MKDDEFKPLDAGDLFPAVPEQAIIKTLMTNRMRLWISGFLLTTALLAGSTSRLLAEPSSEVTGMSDAAAGLPVSITSDLSDKSGVVGESMTMNVTAKGTPPLSYQWYFNSNPIAGANRTTLTLSTLQTTHAGSYSVVVASSGVSVTSRVARLSIVSPVGFTRITTGPGASDVFGTSGDVWGDFNNDGRLDLVVASTASNPLATNILFLNMGDGVFQRTGFDALFNLQGDRYGISAADYDNDGFLDLVVAKGGVSGDSQPRQNQLIHNNGDGTFTSVSGVGPTDTEGFYLAAGWADYDNDGFLDLFVTDAGNKNATGGNNQLWHNQGDGTFARITSDVFDQVYATSEALLWSDYDNDGRVDLLVLNLLGSNGKNYLYHNDGGGVLSRVQEGIIATDVFDVSNGLSEGGDWGDYDNDGLLDLFVVNRSGVRHQLYHNEGGGQFSRVSGAPMLASLSVGQPRSTVWGDYDNDGYLDLVISEDAHLFIYRNNHDGTFTEYKHNAVSTAKPANATSYFRSMSMLDYDNDGFLDLYFGADSFADNPPLFQPNYLFHNEGNTNAWLEVKCVGTLANRSGLGARIRVQATIDGKTIWQMRELKSGASWITSSPLVAHFGLGDATTVQTLRIEWPSGTVQEFHGLNPRQVITITEPPHLRVSRDGNGEKLLLFGGRGREYSIERSTDLTDWLPIGRVTVPNGGGSVEVSDPDVRAAKGERRFYRAAGL